jgi:hypothetical protein
VNFPATIIGPMARAGFTPAPVSGPLMRMAAASAKPMAKAARPAGTLTLVATATTTTTRRNVTTASAPNARQAPTPLAGYVAPRLATVRALFP